MMIPTFSGMELIFSLLKTMDPLIQFQPFDTIKGSEKSKFSVNLFLIYRMEGYKACLCFLVRWNQLTCIPHSHLASYFRDVRLSYFDTDYF